MSCVSVGIPGNAQHEMAQDEATSTLFCDSIHSSEAVTTSRLFEPDGPTARGAHVAAILELACKIDDVPPNFFFLECLRYVANSCASIFLFLLSSVPHRRGFESPSTTFLIVFPASIVT